ERGAADLGATATAAHGDGRELLDRRGVGKAGRKRARLLRRHLRQLVVLAHEATIDPVLEPPYGGSLESPAAARGDGILVAGGDEAQEPALRPEGPERTAEQRPAQVARERRTPPHRKGAPSPGG